MAVHRAINQVSLWAAGYWAGSASEIMAIDDRRTAVVAVLLVDQAILKMMEKGDE